MRTAISPRLAIRIFLNMAGCIPATATVITINVPVKRHPVARNYDCYKDLRPASCQRFRAAQAKPPRQALMVRWCSCRIRLASDLFPECRTQETHKDDVFHGFCCRRRLHGFRDRLPDSHQDPGPGDGLRHRSEEHTSE